MGVDVCEFLLPDAVEIGPLLDQLRKQGRFRVGTTRREVRRFFDSFDWRLHEARTRLLGVENGRSTELVWTSADTGAYLGGARTKTVGFLEDLPPAPFRARLEGLLEMRRLLPAVEVVSQVTPLERTNKEGKTVARAFLERHTVGKPGRKKKTPLSTRLRIEPLKGYEKPFGQALDLAMNTLGLTPAPEDLFEEAAKAVGMVPGGYSSKPKVQLHPAAPAGQATRAILLHLLRTMEMNWRGTVEDIDSEFLHDFRVSVRRTRSALGQIKKVFPREELDRFQAEFAWLGAITGPTRDMDVYLLKFPAYRESLPPRVKGDLEPLHRFLIAHQKMEQKALARELRSKRYRTLVKEWREFLESDEAAPETAPANSDRPVLVVACERILRVFERAMAEGRAIDASSPAEMVHELRKTCKKLRYLLEFFQSLYPPEQMRPIIKALKVLQDNLGDFNDLEVQSLALTRFSEQMKAEGDVPAATLVAMGMLVENLEHRKQGVREEFSARFAEFSNKKNRKAFQKLFSRRTRLQDADHEDPGDV